MSEKGWFLDDDDLDDDEYGGLFDDDIQWLKRRTSEPKKQGGQPVAKKTMENRFSRKRSSQSHVRGWKQAARNVGVPKR